MTGKGQIIIVDSTGNRREDLCAFWSGVLGFEVLFEAAGDLLRFRKSGSTMVVGEERESLQPSACLLHANDLGKYGDEGIKKLIDSCARVVLYSGVGLADRKSSWPPHWFWIPRAISGKDSASDMAWRELGDWFITIPKGAADGTSVELLSVKTRPQFLIALYILCQGFLAASRMPKRVPVSLAQTRKRQWWSVPLLQSAGNNLVNIVEQEWGAKVPPSVSTLVEWIAETPGMEHLELGEIVPVAQKELECRIAK